LPLSTILIIYFGIVPTLWYFVVFCFCFFYDVYCHRRYNVSLCKF